ncbi:hypothetical protein LWI28_024068 [Acer negundo]|uniref:Uncharacterized protein n=1 Tax=Acer negundo TaxID=4023 RepID=A0AAD5IKR0_ACENE|nr:hypothetical protein LWI28_024068 [Acer negundo]
MPLTSFLTPRLNTISALLEEEIAKVVEKGVALGRIVISRNNAGDDRRGRSQNSNENGQNRGGGVSESSWNLEEEVTKVIEVGMVVGFDFNGKEHEVREEIAKREKQDVDKLGGVIKT